MALLTLADLIDEVQDIKSSFPQAKLVRAANKVIRRIYSDVTLPQYSTFTTLPKVTSGTVSVTQDSTTAEFSGTPIATTDPLILIQIDGDETWFKLTPTDTNTGTLSSKWAAATDGTATYTIVLPTISFPQAVGEILRIWRPGYDDLVYAGDRGGDEITRLAVSLGSPLRWSPYFHDSAAATPNDELLRIMLDPVPESREAFMYAFRSRPTLLTPGGATTQTIPLPDVWNEVVVAGTKVGVYEVRDGPEAAAAARAAYEAIYRRVRGTTLPAAIVRPGVARRRMTVFSPRPSEA